MGDEKNFNEFIPKDSYCDIIYSQYMNHIFDKELAVSGHELICCMRAKKKIKNRLQIRSGLTLLKILKKKSRISVMFRGLVPDDDTLEFHKTTMEMLDKMYDNEIPDAETTMSVIRNLILLTSNIILTRYTPEYNKIVSLRISNTNIDLIMSYLYDRNKLIDRYEKSRSRLFKLRRPIEKNIYYLLFLIPGIRELALLYLFIVFLISLRLRIMQNYVFEFNYLCFVYSLTYKCIVQMYRSQQIPDDESQEEIEE
ncbi:MAG: hypothetical protein Q4F95_08145 [Oscillospiraceae bacterium]|nr:hypothetical protein [Oscillospiraceae bacterium]